MQSKKTIFRLLQLFFVSLVAFSCRNNQNTNGIPVYTEQKTDFISHTSEEIKENPSNLLQKDSVIDIVTSKKEQNPIYDDFINIKSLSEDFVFDMKYATTDNFLKQAVYECAECFLRKATAQALYEANEEFKTLGYRIKIFDCYRPLSVQKKMWEILPGTNYVANPAKGSKHNRGAAVDLTLVDAEGKELDMGTPFDFFGEEAHHSYTNLPKEVLENRKLLKNVLHKHNFKSIFSEWWHYEYRPEMTSKVKDFVWDCE